MNSWNHAVSSSRKWGGNPNDYLSIHTFIDSSKRMVGDIRHRSVYHHTEGTFLCEQIFGPVLSIEKNSKTVDVPVRLIAERHILEDLGWLPSPADYIKGMPAEAWMSGATKTTMNLSELFKEKTQ